MAACAAAHAAPCAARGASASPWAPWMRSSTWRTWRWRNTYVERTAPIAVSASLCPNTASMRFVVFFLCMPFGIALPPPAVSHSVSLPCASMSFVSPLPRLSRAPPAPCARSRNQAVKLLIQEALRVEPKAQHQKAARQQQQQRQHHRRQHQRSQRMALRGHGTLVRCRTRPRLAGEMRGRKCSIGTTAWSTLTAARS